MKIWEQQKNYFNNIIQSYRTDPAEVVEKEIIESGHELGVDKYQQRIEKQIQRDITIPRLLTNDEINVYADKLYHSQDANTLRTKLNNYIVYLERIL